MPYINANGIKIYYEIEGKGEPILFIHGLGGSHLDWEHQLPYFKSNYTVITLDLRGHGDSDKPEDPYSVQLFAQDVAALIENIAPNGVHLVGHSLGGMVAFQLVVDFPNLVNTLTIVNSAPATVFPSLKMHLMFLWRSFDVRLFGLKHLATQIATMNFPHPDQDALKLKLIERWSKNSPQAYINTLKVFHGWNIMHRMSEIKVPTMIITADQDYTPVAFKQMYTKMIKDAELVVIPNSRHLTIADQPVLFNETMMRFLKNNGMKTKEDPLPISSGS